MLRGCVGLIDSASVLLPDLLLATHLTPSTAPLTPTPPLTSNPYAPVSSLLNHTSYTPSATAYTSHPHYTPTSSTRLQIISNGYDCNRPRAKRVLQYVQ